MSLHIKGELNRKGQATLEAAFLIPVLFVVMLLLIQPAIILYDRMVMNQAAAEACRMLATRDASYSDERCRALIVRHLGAVPQQDLFHVHEPSCTWDVSWEGDESSSRVQVTITNKVKPLPLFDAAAALAGMLDGDGCFSIRVQAQSRTQPDWVTQEGREMNPQAWVDDRW